MPLAVGDDAPDVTARNQHDDAVTPDFSGPTVLYFYPRDGTPGCTLEAQQFRDQHEAFRDIDATVYGVSTDTVADHAEFAADEDIQFDLLADPQGEVAEAFGLRVADGFVDRVTFVIDDGTVVAVFDADTVNPDGHAETVLSTLRETIAG